MVEMSSEATSSLTHSVIQSLDHLENSDEVASFCPRGTKTLVKFESVSQRSCSQNCSADSSSSSSSVNNPSCCPTRPSVNDS